MSVSFYACDSVTHQGVTNTWFTPQEIIKPLGHFDLDPCTQTYRPFDTAADHICEDMGEDGFASQWEGRVWLNPPYGKETARWLEKLSRHGNGVALIFARMDTQWAQNMGRVADAGNFRKGRIAFVKVNGEKSTNAATGSMLLAFGQNNVEPISRLPGVVFKKSEIFS